MKNIEKLVMHGESTFEYTNDKYNKDKITMLGIKSLQISKKSLDVSLSI